LKAHQDQAHEVVSGVRGISAELPPPQDEKNRLFNEGAEFALHLDRLKCPCGTPFLEGADSAICCVCGQAQPVGEWIQKTDIRKRKVAVTNAFGHSREVLR